MNKIGIIGLSHLGIIWSSGYAHLGYEVIAYDDDSSTVSALCKGQLPIIEPGLEEQFSKACHRIHFTTDSSQLRDCEVVFFAKDTDLDQEGRSDFSQIENLLNHSIPHLHNAASFFFMSQVPVGTTRKLAERILAERPNHSIQLMNRVETLTIGQAVNDFLHPDRIVIGLKDSAIELSQKSYDIAVKPFDCPCVKVSYESAELIKSALNIYLANAVTFVNTVSDICEKVGANIREVVAAMKLDRRFSPYCYWRPGLGFAGGHLEREIINLLKLSEDNKLEPKLLKTIYDTSKDRYRWLQGVLETHVFKKTPRPILCLWGLAYKKGTDSLHNAHCLKVFRDYTHKATLRAYDPFVKLPDSIQGVQVYNDKLKAIEGADAVIILTEWDEFFLDDPNLFLGRMRQPVIIDCVQSLGKKIISDPRVKCIAMGIPVMTHAS